MIDRCNRIKVVIRNREELDRIMFSPSRVLLSNRRVFPVALSKSTLLSAEKATKQQLLCTSEKCSTDKLKRQ